MACASLTAERRGSEKGGRSRVRGVPKSAHASPTSLSPAVAPFPPPRKRWASPTAAGSGPGLQTRARAGPAASGLSCGRHGARAMEPSSGAGELAQPRSCRSQLWNAILSSLPRQGSRLSTVLSGLLAETSAILPPRGSSRPAGTSGGGRPWAQHRTELLLRQPAHGQKTENEAPNPSFGDASLQIPRTFTVMGVTLNPGRAHPKLVLSKD